MVENSIGKKRKRKMPAVVGNIIQKFNLNFFLFLYIIFTSYLSLVSDQLLIDDDDNGDNMDNQTKTKYNNNNNL